MNRRSFFVASLFSIFPIATQNNNIFLSSYYKWTGELTLPQKMSWEEFCLMQNQLMKVSYINKIESQFLKEKKLIKVYTLFDGNKVEWNYIFRSHKDFNEWSTLTSKGIDTNMYSAYPFKVTAEYVSYEAVPWNQPKDLILT